MNYCQFMIMNFLAKPYYMGPELGTLIANIPQVDFISSDFIDKRWVNCAPRLNQFTMNMNHLC